MFSSPVATKTDSTTISVNSFLSLSSPQNHACSSPPLSCAVCGDVSSGKHYGMCHLQYIAASKKFKGYFCDSIFQSLVIFFYEREAEIRSVKGINLCEIEKLNNSKIIFISRNFWIFKSHFFGIKFFFLGF